MIIGIALSRAFYCTDYLNLNYFFFDNAIIYLCVTNTYTHIQVSLNMFFYNTNCLTALAFHLFSWLSLLKIKISSNGKTVLS